MIVTERDFMAQKEYYKDQMRAAKRYQLARRARAEHSQGERLMTRLLAGARRRFAAWRARPQETYEPVGSVTLAQPR